MTLRKSRLALGVAGGAAALVLAIAIASNVGGASSKPEPTGVEQPDRIPVVDRTGKFLGYVNSSPYTPEQLEQQARGEIVHAGPEIVYDEAGNAIGKMSNDDVLVPLDSPDEATNATISTELPKDAEGG